MNPFLETNVYSFSGDILIHGSCLPEVAKEAFAALSRQFDGCYSLCLERDHLNLAITKLTAILGTGLVKRIVFASVDRSPHCIQMHFIRHEIERILPAHIPMESLVYSGSSFCAICPETVELAKSLIRLDQNS